MSRGPGVIERAIEAAFTANPSSTFTTEELVRVAYPGLNRIEKKHRVAVLRAADKVAARLGWLGWRVYRPTHPTIYVNPVDIRSYAVGRMRADFLDGADSVETIEHYLDTPGIHRSKWDLVQPGGAWWQQVEISKMARDGRTEEAEASKAELAASVSAKV